MLSLRRRALVTGGTRGIGFDIAKMLLDKKYEVVFTGRTQDSVNRAMEKYVKLNRNVEGVVLDMSKFGDGGFNDRLHADIPCNFDVVIHNAGMLSRDSLQNMNERKLNKMFAINVMSPMYLTKLCLPYMLQKNSGSIFFFCPPYRIDAKTRALTPYMQTKLAQTTFMYSVADMVEKMVVEQGKKRSGVKVSGFWTDFPIWTDALIHRKIGLKDNCMSPGIVTRMVELMLEDDRRNIHGNVMIDRDYLRERGVDANQWALGDNVKKLDELFIV